MTKLLLGVRRRLRASWLVSMIAVLLPPSLAAAVFLTVAGRLRPWAWTDFAAAAVVGAVVGGACAAAVLVRVPLAVAARAADRGLRTRDAFATALEISETNVFGPHVLHRAESIAAGATPKRAVPLAWNRRAALVGGVLAAAALVSGFAPNRQDDVIARRNAEKALLRKEAARLREDARKLEGTEAKTGAAEVLEKVAAELAKAPGLKEGTKAIDRGAGDLAAKLDPNLLASKAAVRGLERSLEAQPLQGAGKGDASQQMRDAAAALERMTPEERAALAERLAALAETQAAGDPRTAGALERAAAELLRGNAAAAAQALGQGAEGHEGAASELEGQEAAAQALGSLGNSQSRLQAGAQQQGQPGQGRQGQGRGQGQGEGQGQGQQGQQGQGQGQQGQGEGRGQGQGQQGQGQGQGQQGQGQGGQQGNAAGGASGQVAGTTARTAQGGQGGQGTPVGTGRNESGGVETATVYDPAKSTEGEQVQVRGTPGEGPDETIGKEDTTTRTGSAVVPLSSVLPRYRQRAAAALDTLNIPPSVRSLVRAYFQSLGGSGGEPPIHGRRAIQTDSGGPPERTE